MNIKERIFYIKLSNKRLLDDSIKVYTIYTKERLEDVIDNINMKYVKSKSTFNYFTNNIESITFLNQGNVYNFKLIDKDVDFKFDYISTIDALEHNEDEEF